MVAHNPPVIMVAFTHPKPDVLKETCSNILETKEFTTNIISEPFVDAANYTSIDAPTDVSEWPLSGLTPVASELVKAPRVGESAFSMECKLGTSALLTSRGCTHCLVTHSKPPVIQNTSTT